MQYVGTYCIVAPFPGYLNTALSVANELERIAPEFDVGAVKADIESKLKDECIDDRAPEFQISNLVISLLLGTLET